LIRIQKRKENERFPRQKQLVCWAWF